MRISLLLACTLVLTAALPAQPIQSPQSSFDTQRAQLRAQAQAALDSELASEKAGDCPQAQSTVDFNVCFNRASAAADQHVKTLEQSVAAILHLYVGLEDQAHPSKPTPGAAGRSPNPAQTPQQGEAEFQTLEKLWHAYLEAASTAAFHPFDGGTGGPRFALETHLRLVRNHMRELDKIYGGVLHL